MSELELQREIADLLLAPDPMIAWQSSRIRRLVECDERGLRIAALLVARLRFNWLMNASREARELFSADAESFTQTFRAYQESVPPTAAEPVAEAADFRDWLEQGNPPLHLTP